MPRPHMPSLFSDTPSPFFRSFQKEMADFMDQFRGTEGADTALMPAVDVAETDGALEITAEVPGVAEDDLDVSIHGDVLTLKGHKASDREEKEKDYHLVERRYGAFRRQIPLGFVPDQGAVDAAFSDGVLRLKITKPDTPEASVQKIKVSKS